MITANILELLGAFFLGACVMLAIIWTGFVVIEPGDDEDDDDGHGGKPAKAGA